MSSVSERQMSLFDSYHKLGLAEVAMKAIFMCYIRNNSRHPGKRIL